MKGIKITTRRLNEMPALKKHELIYEADKDVVMAIRSHAGTWFFPEGMDPKKTYHFATAVRFEDDTLQILLWDTREIIEKKGCISWTVLAAIIDERNNGRWGTTIAEEQEARNNG